MKHLYFVRHGVSVMNKSGLFSGRTETPLDAEGREQAKAAGQQLKGTPIDCIVASPMERTMETAELIAAEVGYPKGKIISEELFVERDFGPLEGTVYQSGLRDQEGVETIDAIVARIKQGLDFLESLPHDNILVVSHGSVGRALRHCLNPEIPFRPSQGFENGQVVQLL